MNCPEYFNPSSFAGDLFDNLDDAEPIHLSSRDAGDIDLSSHDSADLQRALADSNVNMDMDDDLGLDDFFRMEPGRAMDSLIEPVQVPVTAIDFDNGIRSVSCHGEELQVHQSGHHSDKAIFMQNEENAMVGNHSSHSFDNAIFHTTQANFDPIHHQQQQQHQPRPTSCGDLSQLRHRVSPPPSSPKSLKQATFPPRPLPSSRPQRTVTTDSLAAPDLNQLKRVSVDKHMYREAVQQLARSMRRTELSRRQLAMMGVPALRNCPHPQTQPQIQPQPPSAPVDKKSSTAADFFSARRSTLTDGLEDSRRQLQAYLSRIGSC